MKFPTPYLRCSHLVRHLLPLTVATLLLWVAGYSSGSAQLTLTQVAFNTGSSLDATKYPKIRARVRAMNTGQPVVLTTSNTFLIEGNIPFAPSKVTAESGGVHVLEWTTSQFNSFGAPNQPRNLSFSSTILANEAGSTATTMYAATLPMNNGAKVIVRDSMSRNLPLFVDFGNVAPGATDTVKLKIVATEAATAGLPPQERLVRLESVTTKSANFKVNWKGSLGTPPPPVQIISPLEYRIDVVCSPTNADPISDVLTVTFEDGMRTDIMLTANPASYPRRTVLNVLSPNGGEAFAPCQNVPIRWMGMAQGFTSYVEYSLDNGRSWTLIDSTLDSSVVWRTPQVLSDSVKVRVYQAFQSSNPIWLDGERTSALNAAYSADGRFVAVGYSNGAVVEWDIATNTRTHTYRAGQLTGLRISAVAYIGNTRNVSAAFTRLSGGGGSIVLFAQGNPTSVATDVIPTDVSISDIGTDVSGTTLYAVPYRSGRILRYDATTLSPQSSIVLTSASSTSSISQTTITIVQMDGFIVQYDAATGIETTRKQTGYADARAPISRRASSSISGRLVSLAGQSASVANGPKEQRTFIYDLQTQQTVKILYREGSEVVNMSFSPNDAFLALGFQFNPQFVVYDLMAAKTLPPSGSAAGHNNELTDLAFGPDGSSIISTSLDTIKNVLLRRVNTPESDMSDNVFRIAPVRLATTTHRLRSLLIGTSENVVVTDICNIGDVSVMIENSQLQFSTWLKLNTNIDGDTLLPGECLRVAFTSTPRDTGLLVDTFLISTCGVEHRIPFEIYSTDRDITVLTAIEDFGDVCIGQKVSRRFAIIRNNDSVDLEVNAIFMEDGLQSQFRVTSQIEDSVIAPNASLSVDLEFQPRTLGYDTSTVVIRYADQSVLRRTMQVMGRGAGADVSLSHRTLAFIPEIPQRTFIVRNGSNNPITIDSAAITSGEPFTLVTPIPFTIAPNDSTEVVVQYDGGAVGSNATLSFAIEPCGRLSSEPSANSVRLMLYSGTAHVSYPIVTADPRSDTTSIPIHATITENAAYDGTRFFEGTLRLNPRLFLAKEITSTLGTGEIVSQNIVSDKREIKFRIDGEFRGVGEIGRIIGYAGMAEDDSCDLEFDAASTAFGSAVQVTYDSGKLRIIHQDLIRRIVDRTYAPVIERILPQPASDHIDVLVASPRSMQASLTIVDREGQVIYGPVAISMSERENVFNVNVSTLPIGVHILVLKTADSSTASPIVIIR